MFGIVMGFFKNLFNIFFLHFDYLSFCRYTNRRTPGRDPCYRRTPGRDPCYRRTPGRDPCYRRTPGRDPCGSSTSQRRTPQDRSCQQGQRTSRTDRGRTRRTRRRRTWMWRAERRRRRRRRRVPVHTRTGGQCALYHVFDNIPLRWHFHQLGDLIGYT